jgi:hypothetical protein
MSSARIMRKFGREELGAGPQPSKKPVAATKAIAAKYPIQEARASPNTAIRPGRFAIPQNIAFQSEELG